MKKTIDELKTKLRENGMTGVKDEILEALVSISALYKDETLVSIAKELLVKYYDEHLEEVFGETMNAEGDKTIVYTKEENTHTRSKGIRVKTDNVIGGTKKQKENNTVGTKVSNARDPKLESVYKKRVAVYISHLREHALWYLGAEFIESLIKTYATTYTNNYNKTFGTNFALHYTKPKKDWEAWFLAQKMSD